MIFTERLILRHWQESDINFLKDLRNDKELQALLLSNAKGSNCQTVRSWLEEKSKDSELFFVAELREGEMPIGYLQISLETRAAQTYTFGVCLSVDYQSQGYGYELLLAAENYLKSFHNAHKFMLNVDEKNIRAISCYRKLGYREVGVMKDHVVVQGSYRNVMIMEKCIEHEALV